MSGKKFMSLLLISFLWMACSEEKSPQQNPKPTSQETTQQPSPSKAECTIIFPKLDLCLSWSWEKKPMSKDEKGVLVFKTYKLNSDQTAKPMDLKRLPRVDLWMQMGSHGHGSSPTQTIRTDIGVYKTSDVVFNMPGSWQLYFRVFSEAGDPIDEAKVDLTVF